MINSLTMSIYNLSPVWLQNQMCTMAGRRYLKIRHGGDYERLRQFYAESGQWSEAQLLEYQREQLVQLVRHCFEDVPFYSERWRERGLSAGDIRDLKDLAKLPCTTKEDLFHADRRILSRRADEREVIRAMTGGSTGMPLPVYSTAAEQQRHYAIFWDRARRGVKHGDRYASFQGKEVVPASQCRPPYWRENRAGNQRLYSMRHLSPAKLQAYAESLVDEPFIYYQGYVSFMSVVAEYMDSHGLRPRMAPKAVFCTSEQLTTHDRRLFERAWNTRVWDEYCQCEYCALICECDHGNRHVQLDYGIVELEPIGTEDGLLLAELVCTGFIPQAAPLVRYRVGDRVLVDQAAVCPCGRPGPVIKAIRGRISEYIVTPDGRKYPHISLIVDMLRNIRRTQVVQDQPEEILVRVVKFPQYSAEDERHLLKCFQERIGGGIGVRVEYVDELERLPNGKVPSIISRLSGRKAGSGSAMQAD